VDVKIVHDHVAASEKGDGTPAVQAAGIGIHLATAYKIMHDKVIIVDRTVVEVGSFNYSVNAQKENAENVLVLWAAPDVAAKYLVEWNRLWTESQ
jgi:phosphatidylserine/phosphatidylglycerophosphate/cardiolipin synthase-like enzyme